MISGCTYELLSRKIHCTEKQVQVATSDESTFKADVKSSKKTQIELLLLVNKHYVWRSFNFYKQQLSWKCDNMRIVTNQMLIMERIARIQMSVFNKRMHLPTDICNLVIPYLIDELKVHEHEDDDGFSSRDSDDDSEIDAKKDS